jgi:hypothetical protein
MTTRAIVACSLACALLLPGVTRAEPVLIPAFAEWVTPTAPLTTFGNRFGYGLAPLPDLDGDGVTDLVVSVRSPAAGGPLAWFVSGDTGAILLPIERTGAGVGSPAFALVEDRRPGGLMTLALGESVDSGDGPEAVVSFVSLTTGEALSTVALTRPVGVDPALSLAALRTLGDINGDDVDDLLVGGPVYRDNATGEQIGSIAAISGADGAMLWRNLYRNERTGTVIAVVADQSGDGRDDIAITRSTFATVSGPGTVELLDGASGATIRAIAAPAGASAAFGVALAQTSTGLLAIGDSSSAPARVTIHDLVTGAVVHSILAPDQHTGAFGHSILTGADFSGDNAPDLVIGAPGSTLIVGDSAASVYVFDESGGAIHWAIAGVQPNDSGDLGWRTASIHGPGGRTRLAVAGPALFRAGLNESGLVYRFDPPGPCFTDLNNDGVIDGADLGALLGQWGRDFSARQPTQRPANFNSDAFVDAEDLGLLIANWGVCAE